MSVEGRTGGQALADRLLAQGVEDVFLVPGVQLDWAVDALADTAIRPFVPRAEMAVTHMADGYARVSDRPGVGMVVPGPGVLNAGAGLATAYACNSPVVLLAAEIHSGAIGRGYGQLHEIAGQDRVLDALTKWRRRVTARDGIGPAIDAAFAAAMAGRRRPVAVELPYDLLSVRGTDPAPVPTVPDAPPLPADAALDDAARTLDDARAPAIYAGGGARGAGAALARLAERMGLPVILSENGRGSLPDTHPLVLTELAGREALARADLILVIGSRFMEALEPRTSWPPEAARTIFVNLDDDAATPPRCPKALLRGDAAAVCEALADRVVPREVMDIATADGLRSRARAAIEDLGEIAAWVDALRAGFPEGGIFVNELTRVGYLARIALPLRAGETMIGPGYQGTLGHALPTALGAAVGGGGRRVLVISGDGGLGWSLPELATLRRYDLPVTLVIFDDERFGNVGLLQRRTFGRESLVKLMNPDFLGIARSYGLPYERVDRADALAGALCAANAAGGPALIHAPIGELGNPWPLMRLRPA